MNPSHPDNHDPVRFGPGYWHRLTKMAWEARTLEKMDAFCAEMRYTCLIFPCPTCRKHCSDYLQSNPPENSKNKQFIVDGVSLNIGLFVWIWNFHNTVNSRLGKPFYSFYQAVEDQKQTEQCSTSCSLAETIPETIFVKINPISQKKTTRR